MFSLPPAAVSFLEEETAKEKKSKSNAHKERQRELKLLALNDSFRYKFIYPFFTWIFLWVLVVLFMLMDMLPVLALVFTLLCTAFLMPNYFCINALIAMRNRIAVVEAAKKGLKELNHLDGLDDY